MDFTPPSHRSEPRSRTKSASRLAVEADQIPHFSVDAISSPRKKTPSPSIQEHLPLSPSTLRKSRSRLVDRFEMHDEVVEPAAARRRCKNRGPQLGLLGCASPRSIRRSRRRSEVEIREERDFCLAEEFVKARRRKQSGRSKKEKLSLVPVSTTPSSSTTPKLDNDENGSLDRIGQLITDLIMWKDAAKSSLWFGLGSLFFLSTCFTRGVSFSIFSAISQLGLLFLGLAFVSNSICQRNNVEKKHKDFKLKEDDILRIVKLVLPAANFTISKIRDLFSGEAEMTLKVAPFLILGAEYGHLITLRRLCAIGFFTSFSVPKLYSCYQIQINSKVDVVKQWMFEAWEACSHKKVVVGSAATVFWNFSSLKARIFTAFIALVIVRYCRQFIVSSKLEVVEVQEDENQALVVIEGKEEKEEQRQALVVAEPHCQP
ncbi:reticulon-like protein B17 isoform X1 [Benincasa hispida]|uniref:reticulon-like protein B17 isoform X1 n=1 Tax=Benincasa hispida TaxID=102211 RepID=UPI0018FF6D04|nr:reticulon-like protein B17 isoform X1 [Benincasa hispida]